MKTLRNDSKQHRLTISILRLVAFSFIICLTACTSESEREKEPDKTSKTETPRKKTITILSDSCAKVPVEKAILTSRDNDPTVGFNVYYSKSSLPDINLVDFDITLCDEEKINITILTQTEKHHDSFLNNLSNESAR